MTIQKKITMLALSGILAVGAAGSAEAKHGADDGAHHLRHHGAKHDRNDDNGTHHGRHRHGGNDDGPNHT
ncbi:MAG: hypothetical protein QOF76_2608 [Solirubrobacteraceae bacterium]|jgi:hypothetical protein|nr:hypothetical protein [Solirubrobacteraceae bacterium]